MLDGEVFFETIRLRCLRDGSNLHVSVNVRFEEAAMRHGISLQMTGIGPIMRKQCRVLG